MVILVVWFVTLSSRSTSDAALPLIAVTPAPQHCLVCFVLKKAFAPPVPSNVIVQPAARVSEAPWEVSTLAALPTAALSHHPHTLSAIILGSASTYKRSQRIGGWDI